MTYELQRIDTASIEVTAPAVGVLSVGGDTVRSVAAEYLRRFNNATTQRTMAAALDTVARVMGVHRDGIAWHRISPAEYASTRSTINAAHKPATTNKCMVAIRGCARLAWLDGLITGDVHQRINEATKAVKVTRNASHGRTISTTAYHSVIDATRDGTPAGVRDVAMLHVMRGGGLRRDEVASMGIDTYDIDAGAVRIIGKGDKPRVVYLPPAAIVALTAWLAIRGTHTGALFTRINKAGAMTTHGMTSQAVYDVVRRRMALCDVSIRPHDLRRTYATNEAKRGTPLPVLQRQLGHASLATTSIYMMHDDAEQQRAAAGLVL